MSRAYTYSPLRRSLLKAIPAGILASPLSSFALAQQPGESVQLAAPFSFEQLTSAMRENSREPYVPPRQVEGFASALDYDGYRLIQFRPDRALWSGEGGLFHVHAFHSGWLYKEPVDLFEIVEGEVRPLGFTSDDFAYHGPLEGAVPAGTPLDGVAGFRLNHPLNRADRFDELLAFVGASYFRALGRGSAYGLSARGLAINTGLPGGEEFPRFSQFFLVRPKPGDARMTVFAALESPSVTGAYRFEITPGDTTAIDVTARLFFREDVEQLGVAPLTSMFLFSANNRAGYDDYRPQVHDSDGLSVVRSNGDALWRALNNPPRLARSYFREHSPQSFGLHQRDRDFAHYQDAGAHYERRPSVDVVPAGDWGEGYVELVEIPSDVEVNDNIVAFWVPAQSPRAGEEREYAYRLNWGDLPPSSAMPKAYVLDTRVGAGGVSGVENSQSLRKFVVDFAGGLIAGLPEDAELEPVIPVSKGSLKHAVLSKLPGAGIWRLVIDLEVGNEPLIEMRAHLAGFDQTLSETWLYQWIKA